MATKSTLVVVQSYYDRDPTPSKCQPPNDVEFVSKKDVQRWEKANLPTPTKCQPPNDVEFVSKKDVQRWEKASLEGAAPPPPPMPLEDFDKSNPPPCPTPDYDSLSVSSASSLGNATKRIAVNLQATPAVSVPLNTPSAKYTTPTANTLQVHNNTRVLPNEMVNQQVHKTIENTNAILPSKKTSSQNSKGKKYSSDGDRVEMISIESFTLTNPSSPKPKPPATYFGTMTGSKKPKPPVAVTIGEYQSSNSDLQRRPSKFQFLVGGFPEEHSTRQQSGGLQIGHLLQSELAQTLSRSNLKKQTDCKEHLSNGSLHESAPPSKETVTISINAVDSLGKISSHMTDTAACSVPSSSHGPTLIQPSIRLAADKIAATLDHSRVMIRAADGTEESHGSGPINGILKNVNCSSVTSVNNGKHKNILQQKSISFGEM